MMKEKNKDEAVGGKKTNPPKDREQENENGNAIDSQFRAVKVEAIAINADVTLIPARPIGPTPVAVLSNSIGPLSTCFLGCVCLDQCRKLPFDDIFELK